MLMRRRWLERGLLLEVRWQLLSLDILGEVALADEAWIQVHRCQLVVVVVTVELLLYGVAS